MKKVLVFGAGGFAGGHLVNELLAHDYEVYGCSRYGKLRDPRYAETMVCDIMNADQVKTVISEVNPDYIVNMAGVSSVGLSWKIPQITVDVNVVGALNILETVKDNDLDASILLIGSSEEYAPSKTPLTEDSPLEANNPYGISKIMLERYCELYRKRYDMNVHYVRAFNHTGVGQSDTFVIPSWCKQVVDISHSGAPGTMKVGNLSVARDFSDVRDVVRAYRLVMENGTCSEIYNISSGRAYKLEEILTIIVSLSDQPIKIEPDQKLFRPVENKVICGNHDKITRDLNWNPQIEIKRTIQDIYSFFNNRKH